MIKFNAKKSGVVVFLGLFLFGIVGITNAQQTLPKGGNRLETAVKIEPGSYQGDGLKEAEYFYVTGVKRGQEIDIKGTFTAADIEIGAWAILALYDKDGTELAGEDEGFYEELLSLTVSWLHTGKESDKYYIKTECDIWEISSYTLEVSLRGEGEKEAPLVGEGALPIAEGGEEAAKEGQNWALILGIIASIVIVGIIVYFLLKKKK